MQLAVKEVNTKILSYPDLVHIELSSSCESLSGNNLLKEQKQFGLCKTVLTRSYENFNFNKNNNNNNKKNKNRDHFCWMTSSCPDLSQTCCNAHEHDSLQNNTNTEDGESRRESEDFVNITINENNKNFDGDHDDFSDSDEEVDVFDCINIIGLFKSLGTQKHKPSKLSRTMSQPDLRTIKQFPTKKTPYDFTKLQTVVNQWTNKVLDLDLMKSCNWGMEMSNVVGDVSSVKEVKEGKKQVQCVVGCIPSIIF